MEEQLEGVETKGTTPTRTSTVPLAAVNKVVGVFAQLDSNDVSASLTTPPSTGFV